MRAIVSASAFLLAMASLPGQSPPAGSGAAPSHGSLAANKPAPPGDVPAKYAAVIADLKKDLPARLAEAKVPGAAVALVEDQTVVWQDGFGYTDLRHTQRVRADTLFSLQSVSKTYTATAFVMALDRGKVGLDEPLRAVLPDFRVHSRWPDGGADRITFRHLLSHWAGLCHEAPVGNNYGDWHCTFDEHVGSIRETWLKCRVGERFRYSNLGFDLTGYALQHRLGKPFDRLMREELLGPLGMASSTFTQQEALRSSRLARGHVGGHPVPPLEVPMLAAGGMYSTVADMARFLSFHLAGGVVAGKRLVAEATLRRMYEPQFRVKGQVPGYGLGVGVRPYHGATLLYHGGGGYGYSTDQRWVPEYGLGVVVLTNAEEGDSFVADVADSLLQAMIRAKLGRLPADAPPPWSGGAAVQVDPALLKRLEGTYLVGSQLTTFRVQGDCLHLVRGTRDLALEARGPTEFVGAGQLYRFGVGGDGRPRWVLNLGDGGASWMVLNDTPSDPPGPGRGAWPRHAGRYRARAYGQEDEKSVGMRNGYLYWNNKLKLAEYRPGLLFTADGDSVSFDGAGVSFGNRRFTRAETRPNQGPVPYPGTTWEVIDRPQDVGWSRTRLDRAREYASSIDTATVMVVYDGRVLYQWGDVSKKYMVHSMRKSLLSALYGISWGEGKVQLAQTLSELGIDDRGPALTDQEKRATVEDLLRSRSGVYHPAALETPDMARTRPPRGSHAPGTHWYYNNWDFNALGTIYAKAAGTPVWEAFARRVAGPLQMEDFWVSDGEYARGPESAHPGYPARLSARDLARFGLLYLRKGEWRGRPVLPPDWVERSTRSYSTTDAGGGYGYMWWVASEGKGLPGLVLPRGTFWAWGTRGHYVVVVPAMKLVVVHRVDTDRRGREVNHQQFGRLLKLILDAREGVESAR
jgi:CubicO group peptidase (beta-lactamase class C family)